MEEHTSARGWPGAVQWPGAHTGSNPAITLALSNGRMFKMENGSFTRKVPGKNLMVHATARDHVDVCGPSCLQRPY